MEITFTLNSENLHSSTDAVQVKSIEEGKELDYEMPYDKLLSILAKAKEEQGQWSPTLPKEVIQYKSGEYGQMIVMDIDKAQHPILFQNHPFTVGFPRLLMIFRLTKMKGSNSVNLKKIVAVKEKDVIKSDTPVYHFPFSHVDTDGNVCMGAMGLPDVSSIQELKHYPSYFFQSPFSGDYGSTVKSNYSVGTCMTDKFVRTDFPDEELVPKHETYDEFIQRVI